jgi:hypothetical protein
VTGRRDSPSAGHEGNPHDSTDSVRVLNPAARTLAHTTSLGCLAGNASRPGSVAPVTQIVVPGVESGHALRRRV